MSASSSPAAPDAVPPPSIATASVGRLLLVDDDESVLSTTARVLRAHGLHVETADDGPHALEQLGDDEFDVVVTDISMPGMTGIELLRGIRERDSLVQVILVTGAPSVESAVSAVDHGAFKYLLKPVNPAALVEAVHRAIAVARMARAEKRAAALAGNARAQTADIVGFSLAFERSLSMMWIAYQPILEARTGRVVGHEALFRSKEPSLPVPLAVLEAAERLGRLREFGRSVRNLATRPLEGEPGGGLLFVNLHAEDLLDPALFEATEPLRRFAPQVVLEITERASLEKVPDVASRVAMLRANGFRIAVDDLGAGYSGLASFTHLEPEFVKLDLSLVRGIDRNEKQRRVVGAVTSLAKDLKMQVVAEGVETVGESTALRNLGCDLLQGFLFAAPGPAFPEAVWPHVTE